MKLLITGGAGFIGSHLLQLLAAGKEHEAVVLDNLSAGRREHVPQGMQLVTEDIRSDRLDALFAAGHFDAVIHLAAQTLVPFSLAQPRQDCDINVLGLLNILECCRRYGVGRVIFASSAAVYGDNPHLPVQENAALQPLSCYGVSKITGEQYLRLYYQLYGLHATILRFANVYGERQGHGGEGGVISIFSRLIAQDKPVTVYGTGRQRRDFLYAGDAAAALVASLSLTGCHTLNVATGTGISLLEMLDVFGQVTGKKLLIDYAPPRRGDIFCSILDNGACRSLLHFTPSMQFNAGVERTYAYYQNLRMRAADETN